MAFYSSLYCILLCCYGSLSCCPHLLQFCVNATIVADGLLVIVYLAVSGQVKSGSFVRAIALAVAIAVAKSYGVHVKAQRRDVNVGLCVGDVNDAARIGAM